MRQESRSTLQPAGAMVLALLLAAPIGCSLSRNANRALVQVTSKRDQAKAKRLTHAGIRSLNKQHIDAAAKHFREAIEADSSYGPAHNNLGLMHYDQGNLYQAVIAFEHAQQFLPNDPTVIYNLALALEASGRIDEALELYYLAVEMDQANPHYLGNLVRLRVRRDERDEVLIQQLQDLVLIETRPEWRRWADTQLGLALNLALDRGPATPELESAISNRREKQSGATLQDKIIDLTPVSTASFESTDAPDAQSDAHGTMQLNPPRKSTLNPDAADGSLPTLSMDDLSEDAYFRRD
ncbi:tetratricopeptide repeat protein [Roseiconus lacunae]|uniref:tetratricopeptide repeat protein n=1 Tax=Roseiconus lacunae TaxID=2605694 RepID=UPI0030922E38|nr:tetratricopeptide repeat protein [Stieleria sp. HD01]